MIRGYFVGPAGRRRPYVDAEVRLRRSDSPTTVEFLLDTGADRSLLSTSAAASPGIDAGSLPAGRSRGIGGAAQTALATVILTLGRRRLRVRLRVLAGGDGTDARSPIPSVLGGDVLSHFGLYVEERRGLVLLLEAGEIEMPNLEAAT